MEATCQRCNETLRPADRYCSVCGLPQLLYFAEERPVAALGSESVPPPIGDMAAIMNGIAWRPALQASLILAIPAGVLCTGLMPMGVVWMIVAAAWAVVLYTKRARPRKMTMGAGARIGLVTGVLANCLSFAFNGVGLWVSRFLLNQGGEWDSMWLGVVNKSFQQNQDLVAQGNMSSEQSSQFLQYSQWMRGGMLSSEGRAGWALLLLLMLSALFLLFAVFGGVVGARFLAQPRSRA